MNNTMQFFTAIAREPYRLFFPLGILAGSLGIIHWALYANGIIPTFSGFFHSSILTMVYVNCFIVGFLMTAFPRFTQTPHARSWEVGLPALIFLGITLSLYKEQWVMAEAGLLAFYSFLLWFVMSRVLNRPPSKNRVNHPWNSYGCPLHFYMGLRLQLF